MQQFKTLEEAREYIEDFLITKDLEMLSLLGDEKENKEFRLSVLLAIRPLLSSEVMEKYDNQEKAIFTALFVHEFDYAIPTPRNIPDEPLNETEVNWYQRLSSGNIQAAHTLVNNNQQVNLVSMKKIYCRMVNNGHSFDDEWLIQMFMVIAKPFLSDRVKMEECFNDKRIFFKTFLPEYHAQRYAPLDYLDILYCIDANIFCNILKKAEIKELESKWDDNKYGILIDQLVFRSLNAYMDEKGLTTEEKLQALTEPGTILTESPMLSIYFGRKEMLKSLRSYNTKTTTVIQRNEGRWIYHHPLDAFMIYFSQTGKAIDKQESIRIFPKYYDLRERMGLPKVECLDAYMKFKTKPTVSQELQK